MKHTFIWKSRHILERIHITHKDPLVSDLGEVRTRKQDNPEDRLIIKPGESPQSRDPSFDNKSISLPTPTHLLLSNRVLADLNEAIRSKDKKRFRPGHPVDIFVDLDGTLLRVNSGRTALTMLLGKDAKEYHQEMLNLVERCDHHNRIIAYLTLLNEMFIWFGWNVEKEEELFYNTVYHIRWDLVSVLHKIKQETDAHVHILTGNTRSLATRIAGIINDHYPGLIDGVFGSLIYFDEDGWMTDYSSLIADANTEVRVFTSPVREFETITKAHLVKKVVDPKNKIMITDSVYDASMFKESFTVYLHHPEEHDEIHQVFGVESGGYDILINPDDYVPLIEFINLMTKGNL